jgi:hypothetical protein
MLVECERVGPQAQLQASLRQRPWLDTPLASGGPGRRGGNVSGQGSWCPGSVQQSAGRSLLDGQHIQAGEVVDVHDGPVVLAAADRPGDTVLPGSFDEQPDGSAAAPLDPAGADDDRAHLVPGRRQDRLFEGGTPSAEAYRVGGVSSSAIIPPVSPRTVRPLVYTKVLPVPASARRNEPTASMSTSCGALATASRAVWITASALRAPAARLPASASEPAVRHDPGGLQLARACCGAGQAGDLVPGGVELTGDRTAEITCRPGQEDIHDRGRADTPGGQPSSGG